LAQIDAKRDVERYLSPLSGRITTITPSVSSLDFLRAMCIAAPLDIPTNIPSFTASIRVVSKAPSSLTIWRSSRTDGSKIFGTMHSVIFFSPCIL
jgi:hypothetical protein